MSDLCTYGFGDIAWDEFCESEDHIVPHPTGEEAIVQSFLGDSRKKPRHGLIGLSDNSRERSANKSVFQEKNQENISVLENRRKIMLEKDSWLHTPNGVFASSCDINSAKEVSNLASDGTKSSSHCVESSNASLIGSGYCTTDSLLINKSAAADNNSYNYPLSHVPQTDNDISFFDDDHNDKDSSDFLYYGWPDIGNFEDVDRMFRSCDSTFGLGANNEDELGWFSSSDAIEGSGDMLKSEISCPASSTIENNSDKKEPIRTNETRCSMNDSSMKNAFVSCENNSWLSDKDNPDNLGELSFVNGTNSSDKDDFRPRNQGVEHKSELQKKISATNSSTNGSSGMTTVHKKQQKHLTKSEVKRKDPYLGHGSSVYYDVCLQNEDKDLPSEATSHRTASSGSIHQQKQDVEPESFGYLQNDYPYLPSDYGHPSDHISTFPIISSVKSDNHGYMNISTKESSHSSNQVLSAQSSLGPAFHVTSAVPSEKIEKTHHHQQAFQTLFSSKPKNGEMGVQVPLCDHVSVEKKVQNSGTKLENHIDVEGVPEEFGSTVQESSSVSSGFDEVSLEAASFRQLQLVMEQLDLKTKLCIRDSLYRLARSAEQRHNHANLKGSYFGDDRDANGALLAAGTNKCTGLVDMETDTNPIDRSIAHLLFHRPSDSSVIPVQDSLSFVSQTPIQGSVCSPPVRAEKPGDEEAMAADIPTNVADC